MKKFVIIILIIGALVFFVFYKRINYYLTGFHLPESYITEVVKSSEDGTLILPKLAFREIGNKKYSCVITEVKRMPNDYITKVIKYEPIEVTIGPKIYYDNIWIEVQGLLLGQEVILEKVDLKDPNNRKVSFKCGDIIF
jgi:hypothetical protein